MPCSATCWPLGVLAGAVVRELERADADVAAAPAPTATPTPDRRRATPTPVPTAAADPGRRAGPRRRGDGVQRQPRRHPERAPIPAPWARRRDALGAIKPAYFRLVIDWASVQPSADAPADLERPARRLHARDRPVPRTGRACATSSRRSPRASARAGGRRWSCSPTTPDWAAAAPSGCERPGTRARNRAAARRGARRLPPADHRRARRRPAGGRRPALLERLERAEPSRRSSARSAPTCDLSAPSLAPATYADLARNLQSRRSTRPPATSRSSSARPPAYLKSTRYADLGAGLRRRPPAGRRVRLDGLVPARLHRRRGPGGGDRAGPVRARVPRSRTRCGSPRPASAPAPKRPLRRGGDHRRPEGLPGAARPARAVVQRHPRHRRLPVHGARGRQVPDRPLQHRPRPRRG